MNPELSWIAEARKHVGHKEIGSTNKSPLIDSWCKELGSSWVIGQPWCGTFVAHCLKSSGFNKGSVNSRSPSWNKIRNNQANVYPVNWYGAKDYEKEGGYKLSKPCYGCVAVKSRNGGGHVCFVVGKTPQGKLVCLGGNQSNMVCYALYNQSEFDGFYWYGKTPNPSEARYNLPIITNVTATKVTES